MGLLDAPSLTKAASDRRYGVDGVFNWKETNTRKLRLSLKKALSGVGFSDHLIIGDSESANYVGSTNYPAMWSRIVRSQMNASGMPLGGTGFVFAGSADGTGAIPPDPRWAVAGTWIDAGYMRSVTIGSTLTFTSDVPGTAVVLAYDQSTVHFDVRVDGGAPVFISPSGASQTVGFYAATGLANTKHTISVTVTTGSSDTIIFGAQVYGSSGLRIHNVAQDGVAAFDWSTATYPYRAWTVNRLGITPDVIHIALGVNDFNHYSSVAADVVGYLRTIRAAWPNADVILYGQCEPTPLSGVTFTDTWATYIQALYALAVEFDCPLIDLYKRSGGSFAAANAAGLMGDPIHPSVLAQLDWGSLVTSLLIRDLPPFVGATPPRQRVVATVTAATVTLGAAAHTDYVTFLGSGAVVTIPTAVGSGAKHTLKNIHTAAIAFGFTGAENGDGSTTITLQPNASVDLISDGTNWRAI